MNEDVVFMKIIEYMGEILPDGHISLPDEIQKKLGLKPHTNIKVTITVEETQEMPDVSEEKGWEAFRSIGRDAVEGKLSEASVKHDLYLYKKKSL